MATPLDLAKANAEALTAYPVKLTLVLERINKRLDGKVSGQQLLEVMRLLDTAAFCADGPGLSGVLLGFMAGLEVAAGARATGKVDYCGNCDKPLPADPKGGIVYCDEVCERQKRGRDKYARLQARRNEKKVAA